MIYAVVEHGIVVNLIEAEPDIAERLRALPCYESCSIGTRYSPPREPTELELVQQDISDLQLSGIEQGQVVTDLQLSDIAQGQTITDLELQLLEVQAHV